MFRRIATILVAGGISVLGLAGTASATGDHGQPPVIQPPTVDVVAECGVAHVTFTNPTPWPYFFDDRIDAEAAADSDDYGDLFGLVEVAAGGTHTYDVEFAEDSGDHSVAARVARGPESDLYDWDAWTEATVHSDCLPPAPQPPTASINAEAICEGVAGYDVTFVNPQDADITFKVDHVYGEQTLTTPYTVPAGETQTVRVPAIEDVPLFLRVRAPVSVMPEGASVVLAKAEITLDCVPPEEEPPPPTEPPPPVDEEQPPATQVPQPVAPPLATGDSVTKKPVVTELASTNASFDPAPYIWAGSLVVIAGIGVLVGLKAWERRKTGE